MRIGMFADMYKPHISGVTNCIALHKRHLERLGHDVFVFTFGNLDHDDDEPNVIRSWGFEFGDTGYQFGLGFSREAHELIRTLDIAHVHHPFVSGRLALKHCRPHGIPVVFTNHTRYDLYSDAYAWFIPRTVRSLYLRHYLSRFNRGVDLVITPSPGIAQWQHDLGVYSNAVVIPNAIDTGPFARPASPSRKADLGFPDDAIVLVYLGRLGPEKNITRLVEAFADAASRCEALHFLVIGDGPSRRDVELVLDSRGVRSRARLAGKTEYEHVPGLLAACDIFATASKSETGPLVALEAMASGIPAIGVRSPGVGELIQDGVNGLLASDDGAELSACIERLVVDVELRRRLSEGARTFAAAYDIGAIAETTLEHYDTLMHSRQMQ